VCNSGCIRVQRTWDEDLQVSDGPRCDEPPGSVLTAVSDDQGRDSHPPRLPAPADHRVGTGSGGANSGRNSRTRTFSTVSERSQLIRSAITVAGMSGHCASNSRIRGSAASATDPRPFSSAGTGTGFTRRRQSAALFQPASGLLHGAGCRVG
jgi:hypothetical protein